LVVLGICISTRDVHGGAAAADFLINHRGSGAAGFSKFIVAAVDFLKIHRGSGAVASFLTSRCGSSSFSAAMDISDQYEICLF
jgi:hypothetical protein